MTRLVILEIFSFMYLLLINSFPIPFVIAIAFCKYFELRNLKYLAKNFTILDSVLRSWCNSIIVFFLNKINKKHVKKFLVI